MASEQEVRALRILVSYITKLESVQINKLASDCKIGKNRLTKFIAGEAGGRNFDEEFRKIRQHLDERLRKSEKFKPFREFYQPALTALNLDLGMGPTPPCQGDLEGAFLPFIGVDEKLLHPERTYQRIRGLWRIYRVSTALDALNTDEKTGQKSITKVNRAFLNINPYDGDGGIRLPSFSLRSRSEGAVEPHQFIGPILAHPDWVYFFGVLRGDARLMLMVWRLPSLPDDEKHATSTTARGLVVALNTDNVPIATRVLGRRIPGTEELEGEKYDAIKREETRRLGSLDVGNVLEEIGAEEWGRFAASCLDGVVFRA